MRTVKIKQIHQFRPGRFSPTSPFAPAQAFQMYKRCSICRCYILQEGDFCLCLGCVTDQSFAIQIRLKIKKFTENAIYRMLSDAGTKPRGNRKSPLNRPFCAPQPHPSQPLPLPKPFPLEASHDD